MTPEQVTVLVDWNSQIHAAPIRPHATQEDIALDTLRYVVKLIGRTVVTMDNKRRYRIKLRLYHGWRKGFEPTERRRALMRTLQHHAASGLNVFPILSFSDEIELGDDLYRAMPARRHSKHACHLPNTLRTSLKDHSVFEEKVVDTAIASDAVAISTLEPHTWLFVLGEDDDLIPAVLAAEYLREPRGAPVRLIRQRKYTPFYLLDGLTC